MKKKFFFYSSYLKIFFCSFFVTASIILLVNLNMDPGKIYEDKYKFFDNSYPKVDDIIDKISETGDGLLLDGDMFNDRDLTKSISRNINRSECVLFGSSQVQGISLVSTIKSLKNTCASLLNLSVNGGVIEDYLALSKNIKVNKNNKLKKIIFTIHPWTLNAQRDNRWYRHKEDYDYILRKITNNNDRIIKKNVYSNLLIKNLFNYQYFKKSINNLRKGKNFSLKYIKNFNKEKFNSPILLSDGSIITPNMEYLTFEKDILSGFADYKIEKNYWFDANIFILIEKYIQNYGENFQIIFLLSPYHPEVWKVKNLPVVNAMKVVENKIYQFANKKGLTVIGSFRPEKIGCNSSEFFDLLHPKKICLSKLEKIKINF